MHVSGRHAGRVRTRRGQRVLLAGLFLAVTLHAFHAMAVVVVVPVLAVDLGGRPLYGAVFSAYLLASLLGVVGAGMRVDRFGPRRPLGEGLALFAVGLLASAGAPTMVLLVAARTVEGLGGGAVMAVVTATVNREYDAAHRPRVLAWMSAAWIIPGLVAPPLAGCMAETLGWRWVFLGVLPLVGLAAALSLPGLGASACTGTGDAGDPGPARFGPAFGLVAGVSIVLFALGEVRGVPAAVLLAAGGTLGVQALGRIVPAGKRSPVVTTRLLLTFGFFGADVFLPLALTDVRDTTASVAGALMMVSAVCWSMGAFCHARLVSALVPRSAVTIGAGGIAIGIVGEMVALDRSVSLQVAFWSWAIAGLGMGFAYNATGVTAMGSTPRGHEGETSSALGVADSLGYALAAGIGGAVLAWGERGGHSTLWALSVTWVIMLVACLAAGVVGQRIGSPCSRRSRGSRMVESASLDSREMETPGRRGR